MAFANLVHKNNVTKLHNVSMRMLEMLLTLSMSVTLQKTKWMKGFQKGQVHCKLSQTFEMMQKHSKDQYLMLMATLFCWELLTCICRCQIVPTLNWINEESVFTRSIDFELNGFLQFLNAQFQCSFKTQHFSQSFSNFAIACIAKVATNPQLSKTNNFIATVHVIVDFPLQKRLPFCSHQPRQS